MRLLVAPWRPIAAVPPPRLAPAVYACAPLEPRPLSARPRHAAPRRGSAVHERLRHAVLAFRDGLRAAVVVTFALLLTVPLPSGAALAMAPPAAATEVGLPSISRLPDVRLPDAPGANKARRVKSSFVTAAVESVGPSVVRIDTERLVDRAPIEGYLFPGLEPEGGQRRESGQGSGVILADEGLILTNAHVVKNAAKVTVTLTDGRTFEGAVRGSDECARAHRRAAPPERLALSPAAAAAQRRSCGAQCSRGALVRRPRA